MGYAFGPEKATTYGVPARDLDSDGNLDLLVTNRGTANGFYLNQGDDHFGPKRTFGGSEGSTIAVAVADVDDASTRLSDSERAAMRRGPWRSPT